MRVTGFTLLLSALLLCEPEVVLAEILTLDFDQAVELANQHDRRISEKEKLIGVAKGLLEEANGASSWIYDVNAFLGFSPQIRRGNLLNEQGNFDASALDFDGVSPWYNLEFTVVHPLYTFGKIENYGEAARANIQVKEADVELQRGKTYIDVATAYHGFLTARDIRFLLEDSLEKVESAQVTAQEWLDEGKGEATQSDVFSLETGAAVIESYLAEARGLENIAMAGLRMLTGAADTIEIRLADKRAEPWPLPELDLPGFQLKALADRSEMKQVEQGLRARRALVQANKADAYPNIYAGFGGIFAYSPLREDTKDFAVYDPFNTAGATPVVGVKWDWYSGRQRAKVTQAQAELDALLETKAFAQQGIPFQVAELYYQVHLNHEKVQKLYKGSRSGRRWMITAFADFEAGVEDSDKLITAFQGYLLVYSDYLKSVNNYNVNIAKLRVATGEVK